MAAAALVIAVVAIIIALASAAYTRRQAVAAEAATAIEDQRRHDELTPEITVTCGERGDRLADMTLELTGPAGLDGLDEVTARIRDDKPDRRPSPGSQLTQDRVSEVIWGGRTGSTPASATPTGTAAPTGRSACPGTSLTRSAWNRASRRPGPAAAGGPGTGTNPSVWSSPAAAKDTLPGPCATRSTSNPTPPAKSGRRSRLPLWPLDRAQVASGIVLAGSASLPGMSVP